MSRIAQKICNDIVNPAWTSYKDECAVHGASNKFVYDCPSRPNASTGLRPVIVEKKKVINKVVLPTSSRGNRNEFSHKVNRNDIVHPKETILKRITLVDRGLNTIISGPLRCDNNCVTDVRKRDKQVCCKCAHHSRLVNRSSKEIQTIDAKLFSQTSKACSHCIEMINCGTQFQGRLDDIHEGTVVKLQRDNNILCKSSETNNRQSLTRPVKMKEDPSYIEVDTKPTFANNFKGARRWALSQCPVLGPDF